MNSREINQCLHEGKIDLPGVLPHVEALKEIPHVFKPDFGLEKLPDQSGLILIRGPRQYGKSTWLENQVQETIRAYGPGTALYLNGDEIKDDQILGEQIRELLPLFRTEASVKRLFIDEITAVPFWERSLKRLIDRGELREALIISTGSKAADLRRGIERLPGRKGRLDRNHYLYTPVSFKEFVRVCGKTLQSKALAAYLLSGGCPVACNEIVTHGKLPEYVITMIRDWIYGECILGGRNRSSLLAVFEVLMRTGGSPVGQAKLAREAALANNTVAAGYIELLGDLMTAAPCYAWDSSRKISIRRRPCKFHFINVLAAVVWHPSKPRSLEDFQHLPSEEKGKFYEWLVAQELWRRAAIRGEEMPEGLNFWASDDHELDFVVKPDRLIEVKSGPVNPLEFSWFPKVFPGSFLQVITPRPFSTQSIQGLSMEEFLLG